MSAPELCGSVTKLREMCRKLGLQREHLCNMVMFVQKRKYVLFTELKHTGSLVEH